MSAGAGTGPTVRFSRLVSRIGSSAFVLMVAMAAVLPFVAPVDGNDASRHLHWITAFHDLLARGVLIPKWLPDGLFGFGSPTFYFYPPLAYYLSSALIWITGITKPETIFNMTGAVGSIASAFTAYYFLREIGSAPRDAILGGIFYAVAPYRLFELYTGSSISQPTSFVFVPLVLVGIVRTVRNSISYWPNVLLILSWALVLLTSLPMAMAFGVTLCVLGAIYYKELTRASVIVIVVSLAIGTMLTLYHYYPTLHFQQFIQSQMLNAEEHGNWLPALVHRTQLTFVSQALIIFITHVAIVLFWFRHRTERNATVWLWIAVSFLVIETPYICNPIWKYVTPLHFVQFHTRFGIFSVTLLAVMAFTNVASHNWQRFARTAIGCWAIAGVLLSSLILFNLRLHAHGSSEWNDPAEYVPRKINVFTAVDNIFLPHLHDSMVSATPSLTLSDVIRQTVNEPTHTSWDATLTAPYRLTWHQFVWPQWKASVDGKQVTLEPDSIARMTTVVPAGQHTIAFELEIASVEKHGIMLSVAAMILTLIAAVIQMRLKRSQKDG